MANDPSDSATRTVLPHSNPTAPEAPDPGTETPLPRGGQVGRYVVVDVIAGGGMGFVYSAFDPELDRRVALKLLRRTEAGPDAQQRLLREAQAMARLAHPNVVTVFDAGVHEGRVFLAMEYVAGVTLRDWLRERPRTFREKLAVLLDAGHGLAAAHAAHLVHRDFKPANVIVGKDGRVRVTDFGVAREERTPPTLERSLEEASKAALEAIGAAVHRETSLSDPLTRDGVVIGTVGYMAPEQCLARPTDARTDQFSFCITAWQALFGHRPFVGDSATATLHALLKGEIQPPPSQLDVPSWVTPLLRRGLENDPARRFPSMEALLAELGRDRLATVRAVGPWLAVVAVALALVVWVNVTRARAAATCQGAAARLDGAWDPLTRQQVAAAFGKVQAPWTGDVLRSVQRGLDGWAKAWLEQVTASCEATRVERRQSEEVFALRGACLDRRLDELKALTRLLAEADAATAERAVTAVYALAAPAQCADVERLRGRGAGRADGAEGRLREALDRARALSDLGQFARAQPLFAQAGADARAQARRALEAEAQLGGAQTSQQAGKFPEARDGYAQALESALAVGVDELAARAALGLAVVVGFNLEHPDEGRRWLAVARSTIDRLGGDDRLGIELIRVECKLLHAEGKNFEAPPRYEAALAKAKKALGEDHPELWKLQFDLGTAYSSVMAWRAAVENLELAAKRREATAGPDHPEVALVLANLGTARFYAGDVEGSRQALARALAIREQAFGVESPRLAPLLANMGDTAMRAGRLDEADALMQRALKLCLAGFGPTHTYTLGTRINVATLALKRGDAAAALAQLEDVLKPGVAPSLLAEGYAVRAQVALAQGRLTEAAGFAQQAVAAGEQSGKASGDLVQPLLTQGKVLLAQQRDHDAVPVLERALSVAESSQAWSVYGAEIRLALARALRETDAARARALATAAERTFSGAPGQEARAEEAKALLGGLR